MLVVCALGGNAILPRGAEPAVDTERERLRAAALALAEIASEHDLVVTHGNGPQIGLLALQDEAYAGSAPTPLDVLGAESEGEIGYLLEQELANTLGTTRVVTLLTQVVVDGSDPAFASPTKPIGPSFDPAAAARLTAERGWPMRRDGAGLRRVVPSPEPQAIVELEAIRILVEAGATVICAGGGGVPVTADSGGALRGIQGDQTPGQPRFGAAERAVMHGYAAVRDRQQHAPPVHRVDDALHQSLFHQPVDQGGHGRQCQANELGSRRQRTGWMVADIGKRAKLGHRQVMAALGAHLHAQGLHHLRNHFDDGVSARLGRIVHITDHLK